MTKGKPKRNLKGRFLKGITPCNKIIIPKTKLKLLYEKYGSNKIAQILGCSKPTVLRNLHEYKIPIKKYSKLPLYWKEALKKPKSKPSYLKGKTKENCMILRKISNALKGEKNHLWKGGISFEPYGLEFNNKLKEQIRKRDNYRCQQCFRHQDELFFKCKDGKIRHYNLTIHHIDFNKQNNNPNNLISLCNNCHAQTNFNRKDWIEYFKNKGDDINGEKRSSCP